MSDTTANRFKMPLNNSSYKNFNMIDENQSGNAEQMLYNQLRD